MRTFSALALALSIAAQAAGDDTLLFELQHVTFPFDDPVMYVGVQTSPGSHLAFPPVTWQQTLLYNQPMPVGETFTAPAEVLSLVGACLGVHGSCMAYMTVTGDNYTSFSGDELWEIEPFTTRFDGLTVRRYVEPRGVGFEGYAITALTHTINYASISFDGRYYLAHLDHSIRLYGLAVPEPGSAALLVAVFLWHGLTARPPRRCSTRYRRSCR